MRTISHEKQKQHEVSTRGQVFQLGRKPEIQSDSINANSRSATIIAHQLAKVLHMIYQMHWAASETAGQDGHNVLVTNMDRLCLRPSNIR